MKIYMVLYIYFKKIPKLLKNIISSNFQQCGKKYKTKASLWVHIREIHKRKEKYPCSICSLEFTKKGNMVRHVKDVHQGVKRAKCEICSQAFCSATVRFFYLLCNVEN